MSVFGFLRRPEEAGKVINPLMTSESIELLRSSLTAKETELWQSLGPAWTLSRFCLFFFLAWINGRIGKTV